MLGLFESVVKQDPHVGFVCCEFSVSIFNRLKKRFILRFIKRFI